MAAKRESNRDLLNMHALSQKFAFMKIPGDPGRRSYEFAIHGEEPWHV